MNYILAILLCCLPASMYAQLYATRNVLLSPFQDTTVSGFLPAFGYSYEFARGIGSAGREQAWNGKAVGFFEFYRWDQSASLGGVMAVEVALNDLNDIGFNPRSARWMEEIVFCKREEYFNWEIGVMHQCKHDIDNSDPVDRDIPDPTSIAKRVIIISGLHGDILTHILQPASGLSAQFALRGDYYLAASDYRFPENSLGHDWQNIYSAFLVSGKVIYAATSLLELYTHVWGGVVLFNGRSERDGSTSPALNYRFESGINGRGHIGTISLFAAFEHFFDDLSKPFPQQSQVVSIGLRLSSTMMF